MSDTEYTPTTEEVQAFKTAWAKADAAGMEGHRVEYALHAILADHDERVKRNALLEWCAYQEQMMVDMGDVMTDEDTEEVEAWIEAVKSYANYMFQKKPL